TRRRNDPAAYRRRQLPGRVEARSTLDQAAQSAGRLHLLLQPAALAARARLVEIVGGVGRRRDTTGRGSRAVFAVEKTEAADFPEGTRALSRRRHSGVWHVGAVPHLS